jgi:hypothetical protein
MKTGICKMCLEEKNLIESHLIPRGVYSLLGTEESDPIKISADVIMQTSRQTKTYLLCKECDNLLNKCGETWVIPKLMTWDKGFPLHDIIAKVPADSTEGETAAYAAGRNAEINIEAITHFAIGIFWKASVHSWVGNKHEPRIDLGAYGDKLRRFLRDEAPFPDNVVLNVGVAPPQSMFCNALDPHRGSSSGHRNYLFNVPGIQFVLTVGKTIDLDSRQTCFYSSPLHMLIVTDLSKPMFELYRKQSARARKSKKLIEYLATMTPKARGPRSL